MKILPNGELLQEAPNDFKWPLFRLAFRPLFLFASAFSVLSLCIWMGLLTGKLNLALYGGGLWWHSHEMLFGFVAAIVVGFLLTAVQTWTKQPSIKGTPLIGLVLVWMLPRVLMLFSAQVSSEIIVFLDMLFLPLSALVLMRLVIRVQQWRNLFFGPLLLLMTILNGTMHWLVDHPNSQLQTQITYTMIMLISLLMCILGGRVFPMFTANGTQTPRVAPWPWLERLSIISVALCVVVTLFQQICPEFVVSSLYLLAGISNTLRALRWRIWVTWRVPLVWSLHLSYWSLCAGLLAMGLAHEGILLSASQALHILTIGAMGGMILAMIARVSLGHTGRFIATDWLMATAFAAVNVSMLVRVAGSFFALHYIQLLVASVILWSLGFGLFLLRYTSILSRGRVDGQAG